MPPLRAPARAGRAPGRERPLRRSRGAGPAGLACARPEQRRRCTSSSPRAGPRPTTTPAPPRRRCKRAVALDPDLGRTARRTGRLLRPPEPRRRRRRRRRARGRASMPTPKKAIASSAWSTPRGPTAPSRGRQGGTTQQWRTKAIEHLEAHPELADDGHRSRPADDAGAAAPGVGRRGEGGAAARARRRPGRAVGGAAGDARRSAPLARAVRSARRPRSNRPRKPTRATTSPSAMSTSGRTSGKRRRPPTRRASAPPAAAAASCACAGPRRC